MKQNRRNWITKVGLAIAAIGWAKPNKLIQLPNTASTSNFLNSKTSDMKLGAFSISLTVKDLAKSKAFYEKLGFNPFGGSMEMNYLIMKNGNSLVGLFQGMFEKNMLTFNPGWDENAQNIPDFDDIRDIQKSLKTKGIGFEIEADANGTGPASFIVIDPDGNPILVDQHV